MIWLNKKSNPRAVLVNIQLGLDAYKYFLQGCFFDYDNIFKSDIDIAFQKNDFI